MDAGAAVVLVAAGRQRDDRRRRRGDRRHRGARAACAARRSSSSATCAPPFEDAAARFAPQKGADAAAVARLAERLDRLAGTLPRDPRGVPLTGAAGGLSGGLWAALGARLEPGAPFVLEALGFDARMRAARAIVTGEGRIDATTLEGKAAGEAAVRARQAGVPAHAIVGTSALGAFDQRILDLQTIRAASTVAEIEAAAEALAANL